MRTFTLMILLLVSVKLSMAKTIILDGELKSTIRVTQSLSFDVRDRVEILSFRFALPINHKTETVTQRVNSLNIKIDPAPYQVVDEVDSFGNTFRVVTWKGISTDARVHITFDVEVESTLKKVESTAPFPLTDIPQSVEVYLKETQMVQASSPEIVELAKKLTSGARTEYEAVKAILNYVADHVKYTYNPPRYDALYTLKTRRGNCQNYAHLALALLRASGIPSRIVGGISLKRDIKIPIGNGDYLVQSMGQGGHAWIEIYFPDLGWLSYDPQQSRQFTSSRHIKQTHGLDSNDINDSWKASPYLPSYTESIDAKFVDDRIGIKLISKENQPKSYLLSNVFIAKGAESTLPTVLEQPPSVETPPAPQGALIEFGNMDFPDMVALYNVIEDKGQRILDKETAEYVTSRYIYAQSFTLSEDMEIQSVSLAMRVFGGDGTLYIDLVKDQNGRPGFEGVRSNPVYLDKIKKKPGYYWVDFSFPDTPKLTKGKYWIVLRRSGEAIVNWFYIPGNPYGDPDDTRSTLKGYRWEDIQNYDFAFKVKAKRF